MEVELQAGPGDPGGSWESKSEQRFRSHFGSTQRPGRCGGPLSALMEAEAAYRESLRRASAAGTYDDEGNHYINPRMLHGNPLVKLWWRRISHSTRNAIKTWFTDLRLGPGVRREKVRGYWVLENKIRYLKVDSCRTPAVWPVSEVPLLFSNGLVT